MRADPAHLQVQELFLDAVLHVAPPTIGLLVERLHRELLGGQIGDHKTRVLSLQSAFGFADHPSLGTGLPVSGSILELFEQPFCGAALWSVEFQHGLG